MSLNIVYITYDNETHTRQMRYFDLLTMLAMCNPNLYNRVIRNKPQRIYVQRQTTTNLRRKGSSQSISDGQSNSPISTKRDVKA